MQRQDDAFKVILTVLEKIACGTNSKGEELNFNFSDTGNCLNKSLESTNNSLKWL